MKKVWLKNKFIKGFFVLRKKVQKVWKKRKNWKLDESKKTSLESETKLKINEFEKYIIEISESLYFFLKNQKKNIFF